MDADSIGGRLIHFYLRYEAPYYAVFRTAAQRAIFEDAQDITTPMLVEVYQAAAVVIYGKLKRLNDLTICAISACVACPAVAGWYQWMARDFDDFFAPIVDIATRSWRSSLRAASMVPTWQA